MDTRTLAAWGVHLYTAMGLPLALGCLDALASGDAARFFFLGASACLVDATDGFFARRLEVKKVLPQFDGRKLDDIVDFIHFVLLPVVAIAALDLLPERGLWMLVAPLLASAYGFCQDRAKTDDSFVGFPSYWNILVLYLYVLDASPVTVGGALLVLSGFVFVPIHYVYPSRTKFMMPVTIGLGVVWTAAMFWISLDPHSVTSEQIARWSLLYPAYYLVISAIHHVEVMGRPPEPTPG